jgi:uncharacterized protein (DUF849 family)
MLLQACLNGPRRPGDHPALPVTASAIADDAARAAAAGAGAVHVHPKDDGGADSVRAQDVDVVVAALRERAPGLAVGVTTGAWSEPDPAARVAAVRAWTVLPDHASVNWHEDGADDVAAALLDRGIGVEAGLWHSDALAAWLSSPHRDRCFRVLLELPDGPGPGPADAVAEADRLLAALGRAHRDRVLLHGEGSSCWPTLRHAAALGLDSRVGLEDVLVLPDGTPAPDNAALVRAARRIVDAG